MDDLTQWLTENTSPPVARECPTGKTPLTYDEARSKAKRINTSQRSPMRVFRCGYCDRYHLGHQRGRIY